jgi:hypothetical protein
VDAMPEKKMTTRVGNKRDRISNDESSTTSTSEQAYYTLSSTNDLRRFHHDAVNGSTGSCFEFISQENNNLGPFEDLQDNFLIGSVSLLHKGKTSKNFLGVFAARNLIHREDRCLGEYTGERKETKKTQKNKNFDGDYAFDLNNGTTIDAKNKRGWPAIVNATSCYESSNVEARKVNGRVYYYLIRTIKAGEQLLIYYGDDYTFQDKRFLNPSDNWEESIDKFKKYQGFYKAHQSLDEPLISLLAMNARYYAVPDESQIRECNNVDIPILAYRSETSFFPQNKQENMTLLMLACWQGNTVQVRQLLTLGANPNQQTSIHGYSSLHFVVLSPYLNDEQKIELIDELMNTRGATLKLQDLNDESILHVAIESQQINLIEYLLRKNRSITHYDYPKKSSCIEIQRQF